MKKVYIFIMMLFLSLVSSMAQSTEDILYLGYCNGEINTTGTGKSGECNVSAAIKIPKENLSMLADCEIKQIRVGLANWYGDLRPESITGWIRHSLTGENLSEGEISEFERGSWNIIDFTSSYTITGEDDLYIGFSYYQDKKMNCISLTGISDPNGCWIAKNDEWTDYSSNNYGNVSVEAIVTGDNLPKHDLSLNSCEMAHFSVKHGEHIRINYEIENVGARKIDGFCFKYELGGILNGEINVSTPLAYREKTLSYIDIPTNNIEDSEVVLPVKIELFIPESEDEDMSNNISELKVAIYETAFPRKVLLEQFTTEGCTFCPSASGRISEAIAEGYDDKMVWVCHHVGFGVDWLTISDSKEYIFFYGDMKNQSAPAIMLNRHYNPNSSKDGFPVQQVGYTEDLHKVFDYELLDPGFVSVNINTEVDGENLNVEVSGERLSLLEGFCEQPRLSVFLIENAVTPKYQKGANSDFLHEKVLRKVLTATWGDLISWNADTYEMQYNTILDENWKKEDLQVVAFVHNYDSEDVFDCIVFNANETESGKLSSVDAVSNNSIVEGIEYYTLQGLKISATPREAGIYIKKTTYSNGTIENIKIIINN